jgi:hypothetical protein
MTGRHEAWASLVRTTLPAHQRVYVLAAVPNVSGSSFAAYLSKVVTARTKIAEDDSGAPSRPGALVASVAKPTAPRAKDAVALSLEMLEMAWCRGSEPGDMPVSYPERTTPDSNSILTWSLSLKT